MTKKKLQYNVVLSGKSLRKAKRIQRKKQLESGKLLQSPLGKMRPRQERKAMAKALKVGFIPRYNGEVIEKKFVNIPYLKDGKETGYTKLALEVK